MPKTTKSLFDSWRLKVGAKIVFPVIFDLQQAEVKLCLLFIRGAVVKKKNDLANFVRIFSNIYTTIWLK